MATNTPKSIRNRVRELRHVRADQLRPHPRNWRMHPTEQQAALAAVLDAIGYAGALLARECDDGTLELIDGHLRAATTPEVEVPVLVVDLSAEEAALLLAVHDPLAAMARTDAETLLALTSDLDVRHAELEALLAQTIDAAAPSLPFATPRDAPPTPEAWRDQFQIIIDCRDEAEQRQLYERFVDEGMNCRLSVL
ncbi:MAG: hypothetical protein JNK76_14120 [Planctomycetales bacterium]|nr:hypothetical protein [Planctomycetales bacterium]